MKNKIDHFAIGTASLDQGADYLRSILGVEIPRGGKHPTMGTHNCVMQAGNESFLELLAIDPEGEKPERARWFSLDEPETTARIAVTPRPLCWVVGTDSLDEIVKLSPVPLGDIVHFQRGERTWRLTIPSDGHLPGGGLLPAFIEWSPGPHPSTGQQDLGVRLQKVILNTPDTSALKSLLTTLGVEHLAEVREGNPGLAFELASPRGTVVLS